MRWFHYMLIVLFALSATVQYNDPDPVFWIAIYLGVVVCAILDLSGRHFLWLGAVGFTVSIVYAIILMPHFLGWLSDGMPSFVTSMKAETPYVEMVREFLGVVLCALAYQWYSRRAWHQTRKA